MSRLTYLIDGYNAIHRIPQWAALLDKSLASAREALCAYCAEWLSSRKDAERFTVVFDGDSSVSPFSTDAFRGVRIIYTPTGVTADSEIISIAGSMQQPQHTVVVTDDGEIIRKCKALGAKAMPVREFLNTIRPSIGNAKSSPSGTQDEQKLTPAQQNQITRDLAREWNIE